MKYKLLIKKNKEFFISIRDLPAVYHTLNKNNILSSHLTTLNIHNKGENLSGLLKDKFDE